MTEMDVVDASKDEILETKITPNAKDTLPWVEKYRPNSLDELIAHEEIIQILNKLIDSNKLPHLLFHGPPGTGKFSCSRTTANHELYCLPTANLRILFKGSIYHQYYLSYLSTVDATLSFSSTVELVDRGANQI